MNSRKPSSSTTRLNCFVTVRLANEQGGYLVLGVSDKMPKSASLAPKPFRIQVRSSKILEALRIRVEIVEFDHPDGRVLVFDVPFAPK